MRDVGIIGPCTTRCRRWPDSPFEVLTRETRPGVAAAKDR